MTSEGILLKRVFGDGQEEMLAGRLTAAITFGLICFQNWIYQQVSSRDSQ